MVLIFLLGGQKYHFFREALFHELNDASRVNRVWHKKIGKSTSPLLFLTIESTWQV
jgi:hypothetical protein